jgi:hypothetical protein
MSWATILTMGLTAGIVWGGFLVVLTIAVRKERRKTR